MPNPKLTPAQMREAVEAVTQHGSIRKAHKALGLSSRSALQKRLDAAHAAGMIDKPRAEGHPSRWRPVDEIIAARKGEFERVKSAGDGRTIRTVHMPDDKPYCVIFLGDPHLDSPGTDLALWERWCAALDYRKGVYGFGLGDWLDNWVRPLAFLYAQAETAALIHYWAPGAIDDGFCFDTSDTPALLRWPPRCVWRRRDHTWLRASRP